MGPSDLQDGLMVENADSLNPSLPWLSLGVQGAAGRGWEDWCLHGSLCPAAGTHGAERQRELCFVGWRPAAFLHSLFEQRRIGAGPSILWE